MTVVYHRVAAGRSASGDPIAELGYRNVMKKVGKLSTLTAGAIGLGTLTWFAHRVDIQIHVADAVVSHTVCAGVFISGVDPRQLYEDAILSDRGMAKLRARQHFVIDSDKRTVEVTFAGYFRETTVFSDDLGCVLLHGPPSRVQSAKNTRGLTVTADLPAQNPLPATALPTEIEAALDDAFKEPPDGPHRRTKAVVLLHKGEVIGERYAEGYGAETPIMGYSVSKSIISALIGILVKQGRLSLDVPAPVREWSGRSDPRHTITLNHLLRMTSGLAIEESDTGLDPVSRMLFLEQDMAEFAEMSRLEHVPGTAWEYTSGNTLILSRILRDAVGGSAAAVRRFAQEQLFAPLGITSVRFDFDTTGTPVGSTYVYATARDWARFGMLYLNDGRIDGEQILPAGCVTYCATPTLDSDYGAGFWTNRSGHGDAADRVAAGLPPDSFYASGNFGQRVLIEPSRNLVIVRLGQAHGPTQDMKGLLRLSAAMTSFLSQNDADSALLRTHR